MCLKGMLNPVILLAEQSEANGSCVKVRDFEFLNLVSHHMANYVDVESLFSIFILKFTIELERNTIFDRTKRSKWRLFEYSTISDLITLEKIH